jgi:hypothetical protein
MCGSRTMITLIASEVVYFSPHDEDAFFAWLKGIGCVDEVRGVGRDLHINVRPPTDTELRELIALFRRYDVEQRQLARFLTPQNASWFRDDRAAYWRIAIFGAG